MKTQKIISTFTLGLLLLNICVPVIYHGIASPVRAQDTGNHQEYGVPFGVFQDYVMDSGEINLDLAKELGNQGTRLLLPWWVVEANEGVFYFDQVDVLIDLHYEAGITPVVTLLCNSEWGTDPPGGPGTKGSSPPIDIALYERFVGRVVERYKDKVKSWQIENEVFDETMGPSTFWHGTKEEFLDLLQHAYTTIKQNDPEAKVVLAGFANGLLKLVCGGNENAREFFEYLMNNGSNYFDIIDFHQYFVPETVYSEVNLLKETMNAFGYEKELICTEAGDLDLRLFANQDIPIIQKLLSIPAVKILFNLILGDGEITEEELIDFSCFLKNHWRAGPVLEKYQAENLVKRVGLTLSQGVQQIHWLGMKANDKDPPDWFFPQMPLVDSDGRKKPHFYTYKLLIDKLENFESVDEISFNSEEKIIRFNFSDNNNVYVLWSDKGERIVDLTPYVSTSHVIVTHIITERGMTDKDAKIEIVKAKAIKVTETPIFVEETREQDVELKIYGGIGCLLEVVNNGDEQSIVYWECYNQPFFRNKVRGKRSGDLQNPPGSELSDWCVTLLYVGRVTAMMTDGNQTLIRSGFQIFPFIIFVD